MIFILIRSERSDIDADERSVTGPVATTVRLIGSKWKLLIIRNLLQCPWRFNELKKNLEGISQKVLTDSLRSMEADGIVTRTVYPEVSAPGGIRPERTGRIHAPRNGRHGKMGNKLQKSVTDEIKFTESGLNLFSSPERRSLKCHKKQPGMTYPQCHTGLFLNLRPFHTKKTDRYFFLMFSAYVSAAAFFILLPG